MAMSEDEFASLVNSKSMDDVIDVIHDADFDDRILIVGWLLDSSNEDAADVINIMLNIVITEISEYEAKHALEIFKKFSGQLLDALIHNIPEIEQHIDDINIVLEKEVKNNGGLH